MDVVMGRKKTISDVMVLSMMVTLIDGTIGLMLIGMAMMSNMAT